MYFKLLSVRKTCEYLNCSKSSLQRWIERYFENNTVSNKKYKKRKSKVKQEHLDFIKDEIKKKSTINLSELKKKLLEKKNMEK